MSSPKFGRATGRGRCKTTADRLLTDSVAPLRRVHTTLGALVGRKDSLLPLAKAACSRGLLAHRLAIAPATRSATRHRSGALPTNRKSLHASADDVRSCIAALSTQ